MLGRQYGEPSSRRAWSNDIETDRDLVYQSGKTATSGITQMRNRARASLRPLQLRSLSLFLTRSSCRVDISAVSGPGEATSFGKVGSAVCSCCWLEETTISYDTG